MGIFGETSRYKTACHPGVLNFSNKHISTAFAFPTFAFSSALNFISIVLRGKNLRLSRCT